MYNGAGFHPTPRFLMNQQLSPRAQRLLIQVACSAVLACIVAPGPVLWLTAILVCVGGTGICLYRYRCMRLQPKRLTYLLICLLWLWANTAVNLWPGRIYNYAPLSLVLLALPIILIHSIGTRSHRQTRARLGAFFLPVGLLALIPYGPRDWVSGVIMAFIATVLFAIDTVCNIIGAAFPRTRRHSPRVKLLLRVCAALSLIAACIQPVFVLIPAAICIIVGGGRVSDYCNRLCGVRNHIALCALRSLLALAPLGIMNYVIHLVYFFL